MYYLDRYIVLLEHKVAHEAAGRSSEASLCDNEMRAIWPRLRQEEREYVGAYQRGNKLFPDPIRR